VRGKKEVEGEERGGRRRVEGRRKSRHQPTTRNKQANNT